jgi:hypothetical protein
VVAALWIGIRDQGVALAQFVSARPLVDITSGVVTGLLLHLSWRLAERGSATARQLGDELRGLLGPLASGEIAALALISGFAEEIFFRGALQGSLGWPLATLIFALLHTGPGKTLRLWGIFALLAGAIFGGLLIWRGALLAPMVAHVLVNALGLRQLASDRR